ncbi:hypothetical protein N9J72_01555 [Candidatus Gracilibacteria bacterium]|nr:hypothetical protein [Candidatus Gracilibacteria bacterium]
MNWIQCIDKACEEISQPMHQVTHWALFFAVGATFAFKTVEGAAAASYDIIVQNPELASGSWLTNGMF